MIFIILYIYLFRVYQKVALEKLRSLYPFREPSLTKRLVTPSHTGCTSDSNNDQTNNSLVDNKMVKNPITLKERPEPHLQNWIYKYLRVDNPLKHHRNCHTIAGECGKILFSFTQNTITGFNRKTTESLPQLQENHFYIFCLSKVTRSRQGEWLLFLKS